MPNRNMELNVFNARRERRRGPAESPDTHEDNLTRGLMIVLHHLDMKGHLGVFTEAFFEAALARVNADGMKALEERVRGILLSLTKAGENACEIHVQSRPGQTHGVAKEKRLLIGISSSLAPGQWTYKERAWPNSPRPDAWILLPGEALLVFECKTASHALDATQITAYAHDSDCLGFLDENLDHPFPLAGETLEEGTAQFYQRTLSDRVLDSTWADVQQALRATGDAVGEELKETTRFLLDQALHYLADNSFVPYQNIDSLRANAQLGVSERRLHNGRVLLGRLGANIKTAMATREYLMSKGCLEGVGGETEDQRVRVPIAPLGSTRHPYLKFTPPPDVAARLARVGLEGLGSATFCLNVGDEPGRGLLSYELYLVASGKNTGLPGRGKETATWPSERDLRDLWAKKRKKHQVLVDVRGKRVASCRSRWEAAAQQVLEGLKKDHPEVEVEISAVRLPGAQLIWRQTAHAEKPRPLRGTPAEIWSQYAALGTDETHPFWEFPKPPDSSGVFGRNELLGHLREKSAPAIRKPAMSFLLVGDGTESTLTESEFVDRMTGCFGALVNFIAPEKTSSKAPRERRDPGRNSGG